MQRVIIKFWVLQIKQPFFFSLEWFIVPLPVHPLFQFQISVIYSANPGEFHFFYIDQLQLTVVALETHGEKVERDVLFGVPVINVGVSTENSIGAAHWAFCNIGLPAIDRNICPPCSRDFDAFFARSIFCLTLFARSASRLDIMVSTSFDMPYTLYPNILAVKISLKSRMARYAVLSNSYFWKDGSDAWMLTFRHCVNNLKRVAIPVLNRGETHNKSISVHPFL